MKFDEKDLLTWSNRYDAKVGTKGYFADSITDLHGNIKGGYVHELMGIFDNNNRCFSDGTFSYGFFLPKDAVKENKTYRPFKDVYEFYKFFQPDSSLTRKNFKNKHLLNFCFTNRKKDADNFITTEMIIKVEIEINDGCHLTIINGRALEYWFDNYEITNANGEWQPFGVLDED